MQRQRIYVPRYDWLVIVFYDTTDADADWVLRLLEDYDIDDRAFMLASENLRAGELDTGLTFTNPKERVTVIVLSRTTTKAEFANTWFHELMHCAEHIATANGLSLHGEPIAYIGGEIARAMQPVAKNYMCGI